MLKVTDPFRRLGMLGIHTQATKKGVIVICTSQNMKPLHHNVDSPMTPIKGVLLGQEMGYRI